jgi:hypothetical protein
LQEKGPLQRERPSAAGWRFPEVVNRVMYGSSLDLGTIDGYFNDFELMLQSLFH